MRGTIPFLFLGVSSLLLGQTPAASAPTVKWRGGMWASVAASDRQTADGSLFLRSVDAGEGRFALDGLNVGADVTLPEGWSLKFTFLAGREGQVLNDADGEKGGIAYPEAMLIWTGKNDVIRLGRMYTFMGMEYLDHTQDITASRGLLFTYAIPFNQVGLAWHHSFSSDWSTDLWLFNGEDRVQDNNRGKTGGVGLNYNHGGAADKFVSLMAFTGAEQDGFGTAANTGAEGRKRKRVCATFGWVWGSGTLLGEAETATELFAPAAINGATGEVEAKWSAFGLIYKHQLNDRWSCFVRAETLKDEKGVRLNYDPTVAAAWGARDDAGLRAASAALGAERKWGPTFCRFEVRRDRLNKDVQEGAAGGSQTFRSATSATVSVGTTF